MILYAYILILFSLILATAGIIMPTVFNLLPPAVVIFAAFVLMLIVPIIAYAGAVLFTYSTQHMRLWLEQSVRKKLD